MVSEAGMLGAREEKRVRGVIHVRRPVKSRRPCWPEVFSSRAWYPSTRRGYFQFLPDMGDD